MNLRQERKRKKFTQQQLAELIKVDRTLISKIESGVSAPSVNTAKKIAEALGFDWTEFYEEKQNASNK